MIVHSQSAADPAVHNVSRRIAERFVAGLEPVLLTKEIRTLVLTTAYQICREELDKPPGREREV